MIYKQSSKILRSFLQQLKPAFNYVHIEFSDPTTQGQSLLDSRRLFKKTHTVKYFLVDDLTLPWYLNFLQCAAPHQCDDASARKDLCCIASRKVYTKRGNKRYHAVSSMKYLPGLRLHMYEDLHSFDAILINECRAVENAVRKIRMISGLNHCETNRGVASLIVPCVKALAPKRQEFDCIQALVTEEEESDTGEDPCVICFDEPRRYRWKGCYHASDGPVLICQKCKSSLLYAERIRSGSRDDNRLEVLTNCIICNTPSELIRSKAKHLDVPAGFAL